MANTYKWASTLKLKCNVTQIDDNSEETSTAPLNETRDAVAGTDVALYKRLDTNGGHTEDFDAITDALGNASNLTTLYAIVIQNPVDNAAVTVSGNFFSSTQGAITTVEAGQTYYMDYGAAGIAVPASTDQITFTGGSSENNIDIWIAGSTL
tara:strand:+ start:616 stop:1071 length:456 start_codon:yes stop_codon:yes gene_type:complete